MGCLNLSHLGRPSNIINEINGNFHSTPRPLPFSEGPTLSILKQVGKDTEEFLTVTSADLEDRMNVDIWVNKIKSMEEVEIKECSYNMEVLLGKNCQDSVCIDDDLYLFINE